MQLCRKIAETRAFAMASTVMGLHQEKVNMINDNVGQNQNLGSAQNTSGGSSVGSINSTPAPLSGDAQEKLVKQSVVDELIGNTRHNSYNRGYATAMEEMKKQSPPIAQTPSSQPVSPTAPVNDEQIKKVATEAATTATQKVFDQQFYKAQADKFVQKLLRGRTKYPDFDQKASMVNFQNIPAIISLTNEVDNTEDVLYHLLNDPTLFSNIHFSALHTPELAAQQIKSMSETLKNNQKKAADESNQEPLTRLSQSTNVTGNGKDTFESLRNADWLLG